jgi:hypothetical protein
MEYTRTLKKLDEMVSFKKSLKRMIAEETNPEMLKDLKGDLEITEAAIKEKCAYLETL